MAGPVTITCPVCRVAFTVPVSVVGIDVENNGVLLLADRSELFGHLAECAAEHGKKAGAAVVRARAVASYPKDPELVGRVHQMLRMGAFVSNAGSRACTMCGVTGPECMQRLERSRKGCCPACESGNTHPAPQDTVACSTWAAER